MLQTRWVQLPLLLALAGGLTGAALAETHEGRAWARCRSN